jgi:hypothetical protein
MGAIDTQQVRGSPAVSFPNSAAVELAQGDPRRQLIGVPFDQLAAPGTTGRAALGMLRDSISSTPGLSLRDLPFEVAQQILSNRAETMNEFFRGWSESMRRNAEADVKATDKRLLAQMLNRAVNAGHITPAQANEVRHNAGITTADSAVDANEANRPVPPRSERLSTASLLGGLKPPTA